MMKRALFGTMLLLTLTEAHAINVSMVAVNAGCGNATGAIKANAFGGVSPYAYAWNTVPAQTTSTAVGLPPGTYTVTVTDGLGTVATATATVLSVPALNVSNAQLMNSPDCGFGCQGATEVSDLLLGGQAPFTVTNDGSYPMAPLPGGSLIYQVCAFAPQATLSVTDALGCMGTAPLQVLGVLPPMVQQQTINGACQGLANGSALLLFDQLVNIVQVNGPGGPVVPVVNGYQVQLSNLASGNYDLTCFGDFGCTGLFYFTIADLGPTCGTVEGRIYVDQDQDCVQDPLEPGVPFQVFSVQPGPQYAFTDVYGDYTMGLVYGSYALEQTNPDFLPFCPGTPTVPFTLSSVTPTATINIADTMVGALDLSVLCQSGQAVPGFPVRYWIMVRNLTTYPSGPITLSLNYDPVLSFISATDAPTNTAIPGLVEWMIPSLFNFNMNWIEVWLQVPANPGLLGVTLNANATISSAITDVDLSNNTSIGTEVIVGSFDPNDKLALTSSGASEDVYFLDIDEYIDYTVRFQNTGTAPAVNVVIDDTLSALLDIGTLEYLGSSRPVQPSFAGDRVLRFTFANINLPDSGANEPASHGYVSFRIKPVQGVLPLTVIPNAADIFFDFNPPIRTNTRELLADYSVGIATESAGVLRVQPNPATDVITLAVPGQGTGELRIIDPMGRIVRSERWNAGRSTIDVSELPPGVYVITPAEANAVRGARFVKH